MTENYKAKLLRQDIDGLDKAEKRQLEEISYLDNKLERQHVLLRRIQKDLRERRDELARIEARETVG